MQQMRCCLGVTNYGWFSFLQSIQAVEVNFWKPSRANFKALQPGELFFFKLKAPYNKIGGGGNFVEFIQFPIDQAWSYFQQSNGQPNIQSFKKQIQPSFSKENLNSNNPIIGCILIENTIFFQEEDWLDVPSDWKPNIVSAKTYDVHQPEIHDLISQFELQRNRYRNKETLQTQQKLFFAESYTKKYGKEYLIKPRLGQGIFRAQVVQAYQKTCAITGEHTLPVLQAAHIQPYSQGGPHSISNGILLRSDFHQLFDLGYLTITCDFHLEVSNAIKEEFANGIRYKERHGQKIILPHDTNLYPKKDFLEWHNQHIFR